MNAVIRTDGTSLWLRQFWATTVAFSADADQLGQCSFLVVCYGSNEGDVGYYLKLKDFLDPENPVTEK